MKKEIVSVMMAACLFASLATGCGTANESETSSKSGSEAASVTSASEEAAGAVQSPGKRLQMEKEQISFLELLPVSLVQKVWTLRITGMAGSCPSMESAKICTVWMKY